MGIALLVILMVVFWIGIGTVVVQISGRLVTGFFPTISSTVIALILSLVLGCILSWLSYSLGVQAWSAAHWLQIAIAVCLQTAIFAFTLEGRGGVDISFGQAFLILVLDIPAGILVGIIVVLALAGLGSGLNAVSPNYLTRLAAKSAQFSRNRPAPPRMKPPEIVQPQSAKLAVPVSISTAYGPVTMPAGTNVEIREATESGIRAVVSGHEVTLQRSQIKAQ